MLASMSWFGNIFKTVTRIHSIHIMKKGGEEDRRTKNTVLINSWSEVFIS
jgi:hypothetical protein